MIVYEFLRWQVRDVMSKAVTIPPGTTLAQAASSSGTASTRFR